MEALVVERVLNCASSPSALWPFVSDTERLNRAVGLGKLTLEPIEDEGASRYAISTVSGGFPLEYEELPFEWVVNERFVVKRVVTKGLVKSIENSFALEPSEQGGTDLTVRISVAPKYRMLRPVMKLQVGRVLERIIAQFRGIDRALSSKQPADFSLTESRLDDQLMARSADEFLALLSSDEKEAGQRLIELVKTAPDMDVDRIRPFALADAWQLDRNLVLGTCLHAVGAGLLELTWDLVCPSCRTATERMKTLGEVGKHAHCQLCDISYDMDLDRAVEATFRPTAGLRELDQGPYCIGGPARTPHVLSQAILPAGGETTLSAPRRAGRFRLFVRGGSAAILRVVEGGASSLDALVEGDSITPELAELAPGAPIRVRQQDPRERHVKIEYVDWPEQAATAHHVSLLAQFRRRFAREVLRPGLTLSISRVALLFTDLTQSTSLYTRVGDAKAFGVVQEHFDVLEKIVQEQRGSIVKTIGDAVMAAFLNEEYAVRAALAMHRAFPEFRRSHPDAEGLMLKVGAYAGPCYAVTANGVLDYFGQTVNVAARLQGAAEGGELVITQELWRAAQQAGWFEGAEMYGTAGFSAELKGLSSPVEAERVRLDRVD